MMVKEKRDIIPAAIPFKFGVALAISLGGILYTFARITRSNHKNNNNNKPPKPKPSHRSSGNYRFPNSKWEAAAADRAVFQDSAAPKDSSSHSAGDLSSSGHYGDREGFLLPEFSDLVKDCNVVVTRGAISPRANSESLVPEVESPPRYRVAEHNDYDKEISNLRCEVESLQERERNLETQLLEYYGLKEQETVIMELQNRLKLNNMESKLYNLKIDSLKSDNRRLEAQVSDYGKVVAELEAAKSKIKVLRKKLRSEAERNRGQILNLQDRVMKLQEQEKKSPDDELHVDTQIQKRHELEEELEETKKSYRALLLEKSELAHKLEYVQMLATSVIDNEEVQELHKESRRLRQENEDLKKELDQMKADRCTDIEELVYLRWVNACLRYELRNYKPRGGKTIARDLSKTLSPNSENRAKKLILEYANKEGPQDKGINVTDLDSDQWSSSHSDLTDSGEPDDATVDTLSVNKTNHSSKPKVFSKLMKLLKRKDGHHHNALQESPSRLERAASMDEIVSMSYKSSITDVGADNKTSRTSSGSSRLSLDLPRSCSRGQKSGTGESSNCSGRASVDGSLNIYRRIDSITEDENDTVPDILPFEEAQALAKNELVKYAEALKNSRMSSYQKRSSTVDNF